MVQVVEAVDCEARQAMTPGPMAVGNEADATGVTEVVGVVEWPRLHSAALRVRAMCDDRV